MDFTLLRKRYVLPCFMMLSLVACAQAPAEVVFHPIAKPTRSKTVISSQNTSPPPSDLTPMAIVEQGDTLYKIARKYKADIRSLINENYLQPPYLLKTGQKLRLPSQPVHEVAKGDTLYSISRRYNTDVTSLAALNDMANDAPIVIGRKLKIPSAGYFEPSTQTNDMMIATHDHDTQSAHIAETEPKNQNSTSAVNQINRTVAAESIAPLSLTPTTKPSTPQAGPLAQLKPGGIAPPVALSASLKPQITSRPASTASTTPSHFKPITSKKGFAWPVSGKVISNFGPKQGGLYNDGINISAPKGSTVRAAAAGVVVYAGNELRGYGNLLLIKHANGYMTAYAHTERILVKKGDKVNIGDAIAYVGKTGHVSSPQLHFSLRKGRQALNPKKYLPIIS